jgi:hypothetical protein
MNTDKWVKEGIASILRKAPTPVDRFPAEWKRAYVRNKIRERAQEIPRPKVFGIGLSKTGTTSLAHALEHLGYETVSWARNGRILGWPEFYIADAATDTPCCTQFEVLYHTFEDAKFIYTVRDKEDWTRSIKTHFDLESPSEFRRFWGSEDFWNGNAHWKWAPDWAWQNPFRFMQSTSHFTLNTKLGRKPTPPSIVEFSISSKTGRTTVS